MHSNKKKYRVLSGDFVNYDRETTFEQEWIDTQIMILSIIKLAGHLTYLLKNLKANVFANHFYFEIKLKKN